MKKLLDIIKMKLFTNSKSKFSEKDLKMIEEKFNLLVQNNQDILNISFDLDGYKHLLTQEYCQNGFKNRLLFSYLEPFSEFKIFNENILGIGSDFIEKNKTNNSKLFNVLSIIFIKCNLLVKEIECLITNGFPNGAIARWRSLFEYSIIGKFIVTNENSEDLSERYLDFLDIERCNELCEYIKYYKFFNYEELNKTTIDEVNNKKEKLIKKYNNKFVKGNYGWASDILGKEASFSDILKKTDEQDMTLYYKFSCSYIHGSCKNILVNLANINCINIKVNDYEKIIGNASNIGFTEPMQLTMFSFLDMLSVLLSLNPTEGDITRWFYLRNKITDIATKCAKCEENIENKK